MTRTKKPKLISGVICWWCQPCRAYHPETEFIKDKSTSNGLSAVCQKQIAERGRSRHRRGLNKAEMDRQKREARDREAMAERLPIKVGGLVMEDIPGGVILGIRDERVLLEAGGLTVVMQWLTQACLRKGVSVTDKE